MTETILNSNDEKNRQETISKNDKQNVDAKNKEAMKVEGNPLKDDSNQEM